MKKIVSLLAIAVVLLTLNSCGGKNEDQAVEAPAGMIVLDLSKYGKPFTIFTPDSSTGKLSIVEQSWGALEIKAGKSFQISITEDPGDVELRKTDVKGDEVNKFKSFLVEEPNTLMWESEITKPEFHFYTIQKIGNSTYVFEDIKSPDSEPFTKEEAQKMLDAAKGIKEVKKPSA